MSKIKSFQDYLNHVNGIVEEKPKKERLIFTDRAKQLLAGGLILAELSTFVACSNSENNNETVNKPGIVVTTLQPTTLSSLGVELSFEESKKEYSVSTNGIANSNKVVKDTNTGKIYVDKEAYDNKGNVGNTVTDTKNNTLEVREDGKVFEKDDSYVIKDKETGKVIETTKENENTKYAPDGTPIPDGYVWDEGRKEIVPESVAGKYVYDQNGDLVLKETYKENPKTPVGDDAIVDTKVEEIITPIEKEEVKEEVTTPTPEQPKQEVTTPTPEQPKQEVVEEEVVEEVVEETITETTSVGVTNPDGTYTVNGLTFESKADYEQWIIQGFTGYVMDIDGIMKSEEALMINSLVK